MPGKRKGKMAAPAAKQNGTRKRKAAKAAEPADDEVDGEIHEEEGEEDESESEEENLDMAEAEGQPTELQVEFIFTDPTEDDAPYIRALLHNGAVVKASNADAAGLATLLAEQAAVGTLIKADGELFGFVSALSLQRHASNPSVSRLLKLLHERVQRPHVAAKMQALLSAETTPVGLMLSERMVNTPISLVPHAIESLSLDIDWATANEEDPAERRSFAFGRLLVLAQVQPLSPEGAAGSSDGPTAAAGRPGSEGGKSGKKAKKAKGSGGEGKAEVLAGVTFARVEEEILAEEAEEVSLIRGALPGGAQLLLMILPPGALASAVPALKAVMCD